MTEVGSNRMPRTTSSPKAGAHLTTAAAHRGHERAGKGAVARLRTAILNGELRPGTKLSEQALGDSLGISRNTLREAFAVLGAERIIMRIPNRGVFVAKPTRSDVQEMYRIRLVLEPSALVQQQPPAATGAAMSNAVRQGVEARKRNDVAGMAGANQQFHALVVGLSGSSRLNTLMAHIQAEMRLVFHTMAAEPAFHASFADGNARILALWIGGEGPRAALTMTQYLLDARDQVLLAMPGETAESKGLM